MTKNKLTLEEWKEIGKKAKEIIGAQHELIELMSKKLPKSSYNTKWQSANNSFNKLRSHLDELVCREFLNLPNKEITSIFYGNDK